MQIPENVPHPVNNTPIDLSNPVDLIIYIVLPILVIVFYILYRQHRKK